MPKLFGFLAARQVKTSLACLPQRNEKGRVRFKTGITLHDPQALANAQTDLAAAQAMRQAKTDLPTLFNKPKPPRRA